MIDQKALEAATRGIFNLLGYADTFEKAKSRSDIHYELATDQAKAAITAYTTAILEGTDKGELVEKLLTKAAMIETGEKIAFGSDSSLMRQAAADLSLPAPTADRTELTDKLNKHIAFVEDTSEPRSFGGQMADHNYVSMLRQAVALITRPAPSGVTEEMVERVARELCKIDEDEGDPDEIVAGDDYESIPAWCCHIDDAHKIIRAALTNGGGHGTV